nr:hypothetical protein [Tanacetum cinerariifolium]
MLFPFSLEGASRIWLEKEPPRSIFTWDDLVSKFINQFFPPSKTTNLRNEITRFNESFSEAWDRFKNLLRACPHHGFLELHQLNTFYNVLNSKDQDSLNSAAGGNFLNKMPRECLAIIESKSEVRYSCNKPVIAKVSMNTSTSGISPDVAKVKDMVKALLLDKKSETQAPATVKAVEERNNQNRFDQNQNQGNNFNHGPVYQPSVFQPPAYQDPTYQAPDPQTQGVSKEDFSTYVKANDAIMRNMQNQLTNLTELLTKFVNSNSAFTSSSGTLPSNTIANPRSDLKSITTRSGVSYDGPQIPPPLSFLPKVVENEPDATRDTVTPPYNGSTEDVQPPVVQTKTLEIQISKPVFEPVIAPVSAPNLNLKSSIPYPSRRNNERNREKANNQIEKFYQIFKDMSFKISFADALILMPKFASTLKALIENKEQLSEMARTLLNEHCSAVLLKKLPEKLGDLGKLLIPCDFLGMDECLALADLDASINFMPASILCHYFDADPRVPLILERSFLKTRRALIDVFEEVDAFLSLEDDPTSPEVDQSYVNTEGDILLLEAFLNDDPSLTLPNQENYMPDVRKELKIYEAKSNKSSINEPPEVELNDLPPYLEYVFLEDDDKLPVIIEKDLSMEEKTTLITVLKLYKRAIAWKLSDIKGGFTVVQNEENELILTRLVMGWRVCIDYRKLNDATRKDHFPLPFMDQMLERLVGNQYYCFLDGFSSVFTSSSGTLPSNTIANSRSDLKSITTRSGVSYDGPQIPPPPSFLPKVVENEPDATRDTSEVRYSRNKPVIAKVSMNTSTFGISPDVAKVKDMVKALLTIT